MTAVDAQAIAAWRYPPEYAFYDADADADDLAELLDPGGWGGRYFAVDEIATGGLGGFFEFKIVGGGAVEIGLGLRPDLTGRGLGADYLEVGIRFAEKSLGVTTFTLTVAAFNQRAITVYERAGFVKTERYEHFTNGAIHDFVRMQRPST
jgi:ribosomal-protein-alanine N-acetyltransferase